MSLSMTAPYRKKPLAIPPYPFYYSGVLNNVDWDTAEELVALADGQMSSNVSGDTLQLTATTGQFMYVWSPASNGAITFQDISIGQNGGMDGATWPNNGDIGTEYGPAIVSLNFGNGPEDWYMYRSDFSGLGTKTWKLTYARAQ